MRTRIALIGWLGLVAVGASCGGDDDGSSYSTDCAGLKEFMADCRADNPDLEYPTDAELDETCALLVLSDGCFGAQYAAGCEEAADGADVSAGTLDACAPSCTSGTPTMCDGDAITLCTDQIDDSGFREYTFNCGPFCELNDSTYTGTCSDMYMDQTSQTGDPVCWCQ